MDGFSQCASPNTDTQQRVWKLPAGISPILGSLAEVVAGGQSRLSPGRQEAGGFQSLLLGTTGLGGLSLWSAEHSWRSGKRREEHPTIKGHRPKQGLRLHQGGSSIFWKEAWFWYQNRVKNWPCDLIAFSLGILASFWVEALHEPQGWQRRTFVVSGGLSCPPPHSGDSVLFYSLGMSWTCFLVKASHRSYQTVKQAPMHACILSCSVVSNSLGPHGL